MVQSEYERYLGVQPTAKEVHKTLAEPSSTHTSVLAVILGSELFYEESGGGLFNYLGALEDAVLGTTSHTAQPTLQTQLENGVSRTKVANELLIRAAWATLPSLCPDFVSALNRAPTNAELGNIVNLMSRGNYLRNIVASLLAGNEFYKQSTRNLDGSRQWSVVRCLRFPSESSIEGGIHWTQSSSNYGRLTTDFQELPLTSSPPNVRFTSVR